MAELSDFTMYSGGHKGTEAEFGKQAERYGINEVNFSFEGHKMEHDRGVRVLGQKELEKGNVSMEIVSLRLGRNFSEVGMIRKVIQSIFHMVNSGFQVFAVGWIQEDGTVRGGTGWGVELAKLFNRPVHVYDQDRTSWFSWVDGSWAPVTPVISHGTFCGTGTRHLTDDARAAIEDLFARSFGAK
ncbi:MAG: hypothetical protein E4G96_07105 [Chrysiogenales bacterium]|nr:MAG: hypothetical protein E4G96_07105 [Chrysiogenales bacterium]